MPRCSSLALVFISLIGLYSISHWKYKKSVAQHWNNTGMDEYRADTVKLDYRFKVYKTRLFKADTILSYWDVLGLWRENEGFRKFFMDLLENAPFSAFRWETPPVTKETVKARDFEFVLIEDSWLDTPVDLQSFGKFINEKEKLVISFPNLGKDGLMIAPTLQRDPKIYPHLGAFMRGASAEQKDALWKKVGEEMTKKLDSTPYWLSTAGRGVAYLHVRIDSRPKYYVYEPYTKA